jgi:eukaryotic-like serine/threonine-protein kinase
MSLEPGSRLGPYEVVAPLGAGGMGEVYRARDTRLGREVAVKILPADFASDRERRQRLEREARAVSSLSHPHICPLYDVGHQDGLDFLVMEYLEGETLAARLERGALPLDQTLRHGIEIAGALEHAHRRGIVHRDLKPGNIMLTRAGARLLDFGLAKPVPVRTAGGISGPAVTVSAPLTAEGMLVGTFHYMSPEQVEGREADARSDIFALGAVLHEMATGRRAFDGTTPASLIAAILEREPPAVSSLQPLAPAALDDVVGACLAKDPDERWQTAHDVKLQLEALHRRRSETTTEARPARVRRRHLLVAMLVVAALLAAVVLAGRYTTPATAPALLLRASLLPPAAHSFAPNEFAIAPDGRRLAFIATRADGVSTLWVHALDSAQSAEIYGTEGASFPFWSPDSRWIAFFMRDRLMKVEPGGTGLQPICEVTRNARGGAAWSPAGVILFADSVFGPLSRVEANGGTPAPATSVPPDMPGEAHRFPQFLPDGRRFLYVASWTNQQRGGLYLTSLDGDPPRLVSSEIRGRVLLANDHLLFLQGGTVLAQRFDVKRGELIGVARAVLRNELVWDWRFGDLPLSASQNGMLLYQSRVSYNSQLVWYDRSGRELGSVGSPGHSAPALSPDGRYIAAAYDRTGSGQENLWVLDLHRNIQTQVTAQGTDTAHSWSADGRWLAYSSIRDVNGLYRRPADGSGQEETLLESPAHLLMNDYSRDGRRLLYMDFARGIPEIRRYDLETRESVAIASGAEGSYSPDGRWLVYLGLPAGSPFVMPAAGSGGGRVQISGGAGAQARWRGDGREIFYIAPDKKVMAVPIAVRNGLLEPGQPEALFQTRIVQARLALFQYDVTSDGQRFLVNSLPREDAAAPLTLLANWMEELRR